MKFIKTKLLLLLAGGWMMNTASAQMSGREIANYTGEVTKTVISVLSQAAEKNVTDPAELQRLASQLTATEKGGAPVLDLSNALYCRLCEAPASVRQYVARLKDILFPTGTGPTYPNDVIVSIRQLQKAAESDFQLTDAPRGQVTALLNGMADFIQALQDLTERYPAYFNAAGSDAGITAHTNTACTSWWCKWGKCAAGILGGAATGGLTGAITGSAVPGVGTAAGGIIGAIGGGLSGAATYCYKTLPIWIQNASSALLAHCPS